MSDTIRIEGVKALGCHGVLAEERTYDQPFVVDIELEVDTALSAATDDVAHTISYADVAQDAVAAARIRQEQRTVVQRHVKARVVAFRHHGIARAEHRKFSHDMASHQNQSSSIIKQRC